jgi:hypothetical protein
MRRKRGFIHVQNELYARATNPPASWLALEARRLDIVRPDYLPIIPPDAFSF